MRWSGIAIVAGLVAVLLAGCSILPQPGIQVLIPATDFVAALPVTIVDHAGIVRSAAPAERPDNLAGRTTVVPIPGRNDAVLLTWIGGACDDRAIVTIDPDAGRYRISVDAQSSAGACRDMGFFRSVVLELTEPVGADAFHSP